MSMLRHVIQTAIWKYDRLFASIVALLPARLLPLSSKLGKLTLPSVWAVVLVGACLVLAATGNQQLALLGALTVSCIPIGTVLKLLVRRSRPKTIYAQNMKIKSYSFPSSHTFTATIAGGYLGLVSLALLPTPFDMIIVAMYASLIVIIGISRIHVGAHYPTDVTAGWIFGAGILSIITRLI